VVIRKEVRIGHDFQVGFHLEYLQIPPRGVVLIKGAKDYMCTLKILHPYDFEKLLQK
jgi:hypothetical protein